MGANSSLQDGNHVGSGSPSKSQTFSRLSHAYTVSDTDLCSKEKKKKSSKFATFRKKLIRVRRHSKSLDYGKAIRELVSNWSIRDLSALVHEYDALIAMKELSIATNLARMPINSLKHDLSQLYDFKICADVDLIYKGVCFSAHRALLSMRSPFFRDILSRTHETFPQIPIKLRTPGVDLVLFSALLRYLYTDSIKTSDLQLDHRDTLSKVAAELGMPNPLEQDLRTLLETGDYSDAVLVFSSEQDLNESFSSESGSFDQSNRSKHELPCHKAILAARSPFFRNLLLRRARTCDNFNQALMTPTRIVLDETVIPRRYARVLLHALYLDVVDLSLIMRGSASMCSLSEVQAIVAGKGQMTLVDEAMEIYQIGQFLDFPALSQGSEDIIVESLTIDNLVSTLAWSCEPHGSKWVLRQALHFLREEFLQVASSPVLFELSRDHLKEALSSDFLQAGELDVLTAVLKWGEHHLVKRIEKREPNLLSHTAHSVSKKGVKRRDLNDSELRDILAELLPLVRIDHVIPYNSDILTSAIKQNLISNPPSHMICDEGMPSSVASSWVRCKHNGIYLRPRLFTPYYEEAKSVLEDDISSGQDSDMSRVLPIHTGALYIVEDPQYLRQFMSVLEDNISSGQDSDMSRVLPIHLSSIPDTLYMVEDPQYLRQFMAYTPSQIQSMDIVSGTIPVPSAETLQLLLQREQEIQSWTQIQRAFALPCIDRRAIKCQIQLRVVREFGLPDSTVEILQNSQYYYSQNQAPSYIDQGYRPNPPRRQSSPPLRFKHRQNSPPKPVQCVTPMRSPCKSYSNQAASRESPSSSPTSDHDNSRSATLSSTRSTLSDMIPDIAMATASIGQVHVHDEYEPDIGDEGASRHGTLYI